MNFPPRRFSLFLLLFLALLATQLACGVSAVAPAPVPTQAAISTQAVDVPRQPAIPEKRMLSLEYPAAIRAGDADRVILTLEVDEQGNLTPTAQVGGNIIQGEVIEIPNVYDTHNLMAEARLDMAGMQVQPAETVSETMLPGQKVVFFWSIRPQEVGKYKGTVWFYLRFIPKDGSPDSRQALSAQLIEIDAVTLFGLKAGSARWLGMFGTVVGAVLGFPFIEEALKWMISRLRKRSPSAYQLR
jgi:hypothetical protein